MKTTCVSFLVMVIQLPLYVSLPCIPGDAIAKACQTGKFSSTPVAPQ